MTQARESYDTAGVLRTIGELDELMTAARREDGLADMLLRLHSMAHTVINAVRQWMWQQMRRPCRNWLRI